jgi:hypothetical protein
MNEDLREVLIILQEECAEVIVDISKCFRFGPDQIMEGQELSNIQRLEKELGDVQAMIELLQDLKVGVTKQGCSQAKQQKFKKLKQWSNLKINK